MNTKIPLPRAVPFQLPALLAALAVFIAFIPSPARAESVDGQRADARDASREVLEKLYELQPAAKAAIAKAGGGYATFRNFGLKIFFIGGGSGHGLAHNNKTGADTFMKMIEAQAGIGLGVKKFAVVFVFDTQDAIKNFVEKGWEVSGDATAAAKSGDQGVAYQGAISVSPGVWMYQMTEAGLVAELAVKGTKYYKDSDLN